MTLIGHSFGCAGCMCTVVDDRGLNALSLSSVESSDTPSENSTSASTVLQPVGIYVCSTTAYESWNRWEDTTDWHP